MYLEELLIVNYRSCNLLHINLTKDDPNILIGINDCGKSTILKATENLLSVKPSFNFIKDDKKKNDFSNTKIEKHILCQKLKELNLPLLQYDDNECIILGKFFVESSEMIDEISSKSSNHLLWILENSEDDILWFGRIFNTLDQSVKEIILTPDAKDSNEIQKLYKETDAKLRIKIKSLKIPNDDIVNDNNLGRFKKIELFRSIYKKYQLSNYWVDFDIRNDRFIFPECRYLDWNVSMEQLLEVANDTINTKIQDQLSYAKKFAVRQAQKAQKIVNSELDEFTRQFAIDLPNIESFKANINLEVQSKLTDIFINKTNTDGDIHIEQQGEGVKRQIWFALIKWRALSSISANSKIKKYIWCFDEPETHLYPKAQREFFDLIKDVSKSNVQALISTHSTVFIDRASFNSIYKIELEKGYTKFSKCISVPDIYKTLQVKNSDFLFYDKFLIVEGDTEEHLIPHLFRIFKNDRTLLSYGIQVINLGGKDKRSLNKQILESLLKDFNKTTDSVIYLFDNDVSFDGGLTQKELDEITHFRIGRQDIEDSIPVEIWHKIIQTQLPEISITIEEIYEIHFNIPHNKKINSNEKFYTKLRSHLRQKIGSDNRHIIHERLPEKGQLSAKLLSTHITDIAHIDSKIIEAFNQLIRI